MAIISLWEQETMKKHILVEFQLNCFLPSFFTLAAKKKKKQQPKGTQNQKTQPNQETLLFSLVH